MGMLETVQKHSIAPIDANAKRSSIMGCWQRPKSGGGARGRRRTPNSACGAWTSSATARSTAGASSVAGARPGDVNAARRSMIADARGGRSGAPGSTRASPAALNLDAATAGSRRGPRSDPATAMEPETMTTTLEGLRPAAMAALVGVLLTAGCAVEYAPPTVRVYAPEPAPPVRSVYIEPPLFEPAPIEVPWAPPPMLVEIPPPMPFYGAVWIGGYWVWQGDWVWASGRWAPPPRPAYHWTPPYYEHRDGLVVFITGHWEAPGVEFAPPPPSIRITIVEAAPGARRGERPIGPPGVFVPPPPGSRAGIIVPAPIGTPPAVVVSAAPVTHVGMRVTTVNNNQVTNITNITNVSNVTNLTVIAPASATASGRAFRATVPAQAHLAAALPAVMHIAAPPRASAPPRPFGPAPGAEPQRPAIHPVAAQAAQFPNRREPAGLDRRQPYAAPEAMPRPLPPTAVAPRNVA
ncbi:MAG: hypothetical protein KGL18_18510, partial [Burkholderiales bacterium]|nr:hypothetical protein [Burkholderiales bacterium]